MNSTNERYCTIFGSSPEVFITFIVYALFFVAVFFMVCLLLWKNCRMTYYFEELNRDVEMHKLDEYVKRDTDRRNIGQ